MSLIDVLAFCEHVFKFTKDMWDTTKQSLRTWLGPGPADFLLIPNTDIVFPADFQHTHASPLLIFVAEKQQIRSYVGISDTQCRNRLPWLSIEHLEDAHIVDISDWVSGIRYEKDSPSLLQIVRLYGLQHGKYLAETDPCRIRVITRQGEEELWAFGSSTSLKKIS